MINRSNQRVLLEQACPLLSEIHMVIRSKKPLVCVLVFFLVLAYI